MPTYKVLREGFFGGATYSPDGKRPTLTTDRPLKPVPSWLEEMKPEVAAEGKKPTKAEATAAAKAAAEAEAATNKANLDAADFTGGSNTVETL